MLDTRSALRHIQIQFGVYERANNEPEEEAGRETGGNDVSFAIGTCI